MASSPRDAQLTLAALAALPGPAAGAGVEALIDLSERYGLRRVDELVGDRLRGHWGTIEAMSEIAYWRVHVAVDEDPLSTLTFTRDRSRSGCRARRSRSPHLEDNLLTRRAKGTSVVNRSIPQRGTACQTIRAVSA